MKPNDNDPFNLHRFVEAQDGDYRTVLQELQAGRKRGHWIWFIFPQIEGLGSSRLSRYFAISGRAEAAAYLSHPILGARLRECIGLVCAVRERSIMEIFGDIDALKFRSSMTLF